MSKKIIILVLLFLSWGINQIINDFLGLKEDRMNAPERPMVTGELDPKKAVFTSFVLLMISLAVIWIFLEPVAMIPALLGVLLNILYEYAKGYSLLGNLVFGHEARGWNSIESAESLKRQEKSSMRTTGKLI